MASTRHAPGSSYQGWGGALADPVQLAQWGREGWELSTGSAPRPELCELSTDLTRPAAGQPTAPSVAAMNISHRTLFRPVVVAVVAVALAGCVAVSPTEPGGGPSSDSVAAAAQTDVTVAEEAQLDDDDDEVDGPGSGDVDGGGAIDTEWAFTIPVRDWDTDLSIRPPSPEPLVDHLPDTSVLRAGEPQLSPRFEQLLSSPGSEPAARVAMATIKATAHLVNDGYLWEFAPAAASTCGYCLLRLLAAQEIHEGSGEQYEPWAVDFGTGAAVWELSGADHLMIEFSAQQSLLTYEIGNRTQILDGAGPHTYQVEMLFDEGQWWVLAVGARAL